MTTETIKLFDNNSKLIDNFDEEIEKVLISIHGEHYFDIDEPIQDTRELKKLKTQVNTALSEKKITNTHKVSIKDFLPVTFFLCVFIIVLMAGYYFLNTIDLMSFIK